MAMRVEWWTALEQSERRMSGRIGSVSSGPRARSWFRHSARDAWLIVALAAAALATAAAFVLAASSMLWGSALAALVFGAAICFCSNTVSHIHLHTPLFRRRAANRALNLALTLLLGVPQSVWRARHLWHHAGEPPRRTRRLPRGATVEFALVAALWLALLLLAPRLFLTAYVPGYVLGMLLCRLQGDMEHAGEHDAARGVSHYGALYNFFWFNDGHHVEHHAHPALHWTKLPAARVSGAPESALPPHLRFFEGLAGRMKGALLCALERLALASTLLQAFMIRSHERAFRRLLAALPTAPRRIAVIGGGLFPRTVLVLARVLPDAQVVVIDRSARNIECARRLLAARGVAPRVRFEHANFDPERHGDVDLVIAPLGFVGSRRGLGRAAARVAVLSHDWLWQRRSRHSAVISPWLLKRASLTLPANAEGESDREVEALPRAA